MCCVIGSPPHAFSPVAGIEHAEKLCLQDGNPKLPTTNAETCMGSAWLPV
eukprot:CAMPEP_0204589734 /NCGR_PEP_ID=MMETSP0661-20131031/49380_1 /ASSEMBLY_ACC=CAM_ASM_000606 /TAXON_ID=109239 /ORGANISM="Alexandrium margalefi, Strain AMGDE01CS-322" /LENGTH=49 /DNA_ID= /DNA_START= /DNA_END= /DNA_ORIENTATION=